MRNCGSRDLLVDLQRVEPLIGLKSAELSLARFNSDRVRFARGAPLSS